MKKLAALVTRTLVRKCPAKVFSVALFFLSTIVAMPGVWGSETPLISHKVSGRFILTFQFQIDEQPSEYSTEYRIP